MALCACNVLGPRYDVRKQRIELRYEPDAAAAHARVDYELKNTGNAALTQLAVKMPPNLNASAATLITPEAARRELPLNQAWPPKKIYKTAIEYSFAAQHTGSAALFIADANWLPQLLPPDAVMASGGGPPEKLEMYVTLPADFRVAAPGKYRGADAQGAARRHRFEITSSDVPPYVVAGRYAEQVADGSGFRLHMWTAAPLERAQAERVTARLAQAVATYVSQLGPLPDKRTHLFLIDGLVDAPGAGSGETFVFPAGIVFHPPLFASGSVDEAGMCRAARWLAGVWFEAVSKPREEARDLAEALALSLAATAQPQCSTTNRAASAESGVSLEREKGRLFVAALEQKIGTPALHAALKRMVQSLAGSEWDLGALRSATEGESKQDLADFFRVWNEPGIPAALRRQ